MFKMTDKLDPNRFAGPYEEPHLRAHVEEDELELDLLRTKSERAKRALEEADERFRAIEQQFKEYKHIRDDAAAYAAEVQRKYDAQVSVVSLRKAYFHPMRKLSDEALERILLFTIGDLTFVGKETTAEGMIARQRQPSALAKVCRRWRQVALQSGGVGSQIEYDLDKSTGASSYRMS
ncbi:hypothetical protein AURDEDRAFT_178767 [Auricularia subglabra TFB-10046 SS5]|uniref:F-box domain-containing protein n=1 Tax=Auricularia subglabra (strain TFB-10046 / SS5) TaxID=717982 RepID=J0L7B5_AURST|nr:hypothetical protein AURDEDRAFT_178767 [Auricularia subglabra TFB-10046 SS5]